MKSQNLPQSTSPAENPVFWGVGMSNILRKSSVCSASYMWKSNFMPKQSLLLINFPQKFIERKLLYRVWCIRTAVILPHRNVAAYKSVITKSVKKLRSHPNKATIITVRRTAWAKLLLWNIVQTFQSIRSVFCSSWISTLSFGFFREASVGNRGPNPQPFSSRRTTSRTRFPGAERGKWFML